MSGGFPPARSIASNMDTYIVYVWDSIYNTSGVLCAFLCHHFMHFSAFIILVMMQCSYLFISGLTLALPQSHLPLQFANVYSIGMLGGPSLCVFFKTRVGKQSFLTVWA